MKKLALAAMVLALGCDRGKPPVPPGAGAPTRERTSLSAFESNLAELVGTLRFLNIEYAAAVKDGKVVDEVEHREASMAAGQAGRLWKQVAAELEAKDAAAAKAAGEGIAELQKKVKANAEPPEVAALVAALTKTLEAHIEGGVSPNVRATAASVRAADADIKGERAVGEYRLGLVAFAPRTLGSYDEAGTWTEFRRMGPLTHLIGVVVREQGTKRPLSSAKVVARWGEETVTLEPIWGDYLFYGANVPLPEGTFTLSVDVAPPQICRHGDAMAQWVEPARAEFKVTRHGGEVTVEAPKPAPANADYRVGEDVEQALAESLFVKDEGDYRIGFIAEGPEPIWVWENGVLEAKPARDGDTHHLEIALLERGTNRIVMGAKVALALKNKATGEVRNVVMHNLLSSFAHYGNTIQIAPGAYEVTATVVPPRWLQFEKGRFGKAVSVVFDWDGKPKQE